jgi:hypothetical protein
MLPIATDAIGSFCSADEISAVTQLTQIAFGHPVVVAILVEDRDADLLAETGEAQRAVAPGRLR